MNQSNETHATLTLVSGWPERFSRVQVLLRFLVLIVLSTIGGAIGWPGLIVYLGIPAVAAILVSERGGKAFIEQEAPRLVGALRWLMGLYAYLGLLTDRFPVGRADEIVHLEVTPAGQPSTSSAVLRIVYSLPAAILLWLLGLASAFIWLIASVCILVSETYPRSLFDFQCAVLRFHARFLAYHSSLVDTYPPIALEFGPKGSEPRGGQPMTSFR